MNSLCLSLIFTLCIIAVSLSAVVYFQAQEMRCIRLRLGQSLHKIALMEVQNDPIQTRMRGGGKV